MTDNLPNVATYTVGPYGVRAEERKRFVATYCGHLYTTAPVVADRKVTMLATNRNEARITAQHIARDNCWALVDVPK